MFASAVEAFVEEADPFFQVVSVQSEHSVANHLLLSNQTLQLVPSEALQPAGSQNKVFGMSLKVP